MGEEILPDQQLQHQLCLLHGIHLAIVDALYKRKPKKMQEEEESESYHEIAMDDQEEEQEEEEDQFHFPVPALQTEDVDLVQDISMVVEKIWKVVKLPIERVP